MQLPLQRRSGSTARSQNSSEYCISPVLFFSFFCPSLSSLILFLPLLLAFWVPRSFLSSIASSTVSILCFLSSVYFFLSSGRKLFGHPRKSSFTSNLDIWRFFCTRRSPFFLVCSSADILLFFFCVALLTFHLTYCYCLLCIFLSATSLQGYKTNSGEGKVKSSKSHHRFQIEKRSADQNKKERRRKWETGKKRHTKEAIRDKWDRSSSV